MSLLMKALKQAERDHEEAINNDIESTTDAEFEESAPTTTVGEKGQYSSGEKSQSLSADDRGMELALEGASASKAYVDQSDSLVQDAARLNDDSNSDDAFGFDLEEHGARDQVSAPESRSSEPMDLSRHREDSHPSYDETTSVETVPEFLAEPPTLVTEQTDNWGGGGETADHGLEIDLDEDLESEQALIDSADAGAFMATAKLATAKKKPSLLGKIIVGLLLAVIAIAGIGWYALQLLHIPTPNSGPVFDPESSRSTFASSDLTTRSPAQVGGRTNQTNIESASSSKANSSDNASANAQQGDVAVTKPGGATDKSTSSPESATPAKPASPTKSARANAASSAPSETSKPKAKPVLKRVAPKPTSLPALVANQSLSGATSSDAKPAIQFRKVASAQEKQATLLNEAYAALRVNDDAKAELLYKQALANDQLSADVWVGLATLSVRRGDIVQAQQAYENALRINPNDSAAVAGQLSLQGESDAVSRESRYRNLLAANPNNAALQFALASALAAQNRWVDAQQAYFSAAAAEPGHPDYAFNLAVALEHIRQPAVALQYYSRALELAAKRQPEFDVATAKQRIDALRSRSGRN